MPTTPSSDPLHILLAHDAWGTRQILEACRPLSHAQFHRRFEIGPGSLHDTLTHIISVMRRWTDRLAGREPRPALHAVTERPDIPHEAADRTVDELLALLDDAAAGLASTAAECVRKGLGTTIQMNWPSKQGGQKRYTFTRAAVLVHVATHGMHHRAQCLNMLRHLNAPGISDNLPDPSTVDWQAQIELPPTIVQA